MQATRRVLNDRAPTGCGSRRRAPGIERIEAYFAGHGFDPHRHDTYAIGFTIAGVQAFRYRGAARHSLPGQVFVLHPDEIHDGRAGTGAGFRYRILYVEPRLIGAALRRAPLPFVRDAVSDDARLARAIAPALDDLDAPLEELQRDRSLLELADALAARRSVDRATAAPARAHARGRAGARVPRRASRARGRLGGTGSRHRASRATPWRGISARASAPARIATS